MRIETYNIYKYDELTDEQKDKAIENLRDINVGYDWWDCVYEDAKMIGLDITSFDLYRNRHATGTFSTSAEDCAQLIIKEHGESCDSYRLAAHYLAEVKKTPDGCTEGDGCEDCEAANEALADDLLVGLLEYYAIMLQNEYEYKLSDIAIVETIEANDYEFTEDGKLV